MGAIASCALAVTALAAGPARVVSAQGADTLASLRVRVVADSAPVMSARVAADGAVARTDQGGLAVLRLGAGRYRVVTTKLGFRSDTATVLLAAGADTGIVVWLSREESTLEEIVVSATRSGRRVEDTPLRVEVLTREEVEEKMLMTPGDITMMLNETGGLRVQTTSPSLGGANVRVQGMRGRYTLMLTDGLPLYGGQSGALGLLQIPPMDLARVEVVKGVASALYGSSAMGGVINLVSRRPAEEAESEVLVNATTRRGLDGVAWASGPLTDRIGYTLLAGRHEQPDVRVDGDGWTDIPGYQRTVARPRVFWMGERGQSLTATLGATVEDRSGGGVTPTAVGFPEALRTRRFDAGVLAGVPLAAGVLNIRASGTTQGHRHTFGGTLERDRHVTGFVEGSLAMAHGGATTVLGGAWHVESYESTDVPRHDYTFQVPAIFAQLERDAGERVAFTVSARADFHSAYGSLVNPRVSLLYRLAPGWTARASAGTGAFAPTPFTEETEATGLAPLSALRGLRPERARSGSLDVAGEAGPFEVSAALFASRITDALLVRVPASDPAGLELLNATEPTLSTGLDAMLRLRAGDLTTTASYTFVRAREQESAGSPAMRDVPLTPRHSAGFVAIWEREGKGRVGAEYYYTGRQSLDENPYRAVSVPYSVVGAIGEWHVGRARLFLNLENLGDVRLGRHHPIVRQSAGPGGRWTVDAWAPLEGRVINGGVRVALGRAGDEH